MIFFEILVYSLIIVGLTAMIVWMHFDEGKTK
jgi:hypothetical protein